MPVATPLINQIELNVDNLVNLDWDRPDQMITKNEFDTRESSPGGLSALTGGEPYGSWAEFKDQFIKYQESIGFKWQRASGRGGPIKLSEVALGGAVGAELARIEISRNSDGGNFEALIRRSFPKLFAYVTEPAFEVIDYQRARNGFKNASEENKSYKFGAGRGNISYSLSVLEYSFADPNKKGQRGRNEFALGEAIMQQLRQLLDLDLLVHTQTERASRSLENADFEGFRVQRHIEGDRFLMYSFELKPMNGIRAVSDAISQAINYKGRSHFTYIVIPLFDQTSFHDPDRLDDLLHMCRSNEIGAISVDIDPATNEVLGVTQVLRAVETPMEDSSRLDSMITEGGWELCPLCRKIVEVSEDERSGCGWLVDVDEGSSTECMKNLMQGFYARGR